MGEMEETYMMAAIEDAVNQLKILGTTELFKLKPNKFLSRQISQDINNILTNHQDLFDKYKDIIQDSGESRVRAHLQHFESELRNCIENVENLKKANEDRKKVESFLEGMKKGFGVLEEGVEREKKERREMRELMDEQERGKAELRSLSKIVSEFRREREREVQNKNEIIAHLKDKIQELKAKTSMEEKYIDKLSRVEEDKVHTRSAMSDRSYQKEVQKIRGKRESEERCTTEMTSFIQRQIEKLGQRIEECSAAYDVDVEAKQRELEELGSVKAANLRELKRLKIMCYDYRHIIASHKYESAKEGREREDHSDLWEAASTIQAWFRGVIARHGLAQAPKKKGKKGKK